MRKVQFKGRRMDMEMHPQLVQMACGALAFLVSLVGVYGLMLWLVFGYPSRN